jgi:hypothetical protein
MIAGTDEDIPPLPSTGPKFDPVELLTLIKECFHEVGKEVLVSDWTEFRRTKWTGTAEFLMEESKFKQIDHLRSWARSLVENSDKSVRFVTGFAEPGPEGFIHGKILVDGSV